MCVLVILPGGDFQAEVLENGERVVADGLMIQPALFVLNNERAEVPHHPSAGREHFRDVIVFVLFVNLIKNDVLEPVWDGASGPVRVSDE